MALVIISVTKRQSTIFQVAQNKGLNPVSSYKKSVFQKLSHGVPPKEVEAHIIM
jgi:hypothetical protein